MPRAKKSVTRADRPQRVTLRDIAAIAGVHVMTVSDALKRNIKIVLLLSDTAASKAARHILPEMRQ